MATEIYDCKEFPKTGGITIPAKYREKLGMLPGDVVDVNYENNQICIEKEDPDSLHNKRWVSEKGKVLIPKEILNIAKITKDKEYCLYIDEEKKQVIITIIAS